MRFFWLAAAAMLSLPANAQDVLGTSIVNGRSVQIMSDYTWKYDSPAPEGCISIKSKVSFCGQNLGWKIYPKESDDRIMFRLNDITYGMFIVEDVGSTGGVTQAFIRQSVLRNAASGAKTTTKDIPTFGIEPISIADLTGETISYAVKIDDLSIIFTNTMLIDKYKNVQVITYAIGQALTDEMKANHKGFLEATRFN